MEDNMDEKPIYEIYVFEKEWTLDEQGFIQTGISERVGYYYEKETAIKAVEENWCNLQDHYASAALVQAVEPGLYPHPPRAKSWYFVWDSKEEKFKAAKMPEVDWWFK